MAVVTAYQIVINEVLLYLFERPMNFSGNSY